jgi:nicotinamidase-related amidase
VAGVRHCLIFAARRLLLEQNSRRKTMMTTPLPVVPEGILVIVDMQSQGFPLARSAMRGVKQEVLRAIARGWHIVVVEYDLECAGQTDSDLLALLAGYANWQTVKKAKEDGSQEVVAHCLLKELQPKLFRVVGVMTDVCVAQTACGLVGRLSDCSLEVVKSACACAFSRYDWNEFPVHERILLVD